MLSGNIKQRRKKIISNPKLELPGTKIFLNMENIKQKMEMVKSLENKRVKATKEINASLCKAKNYF